MNDPKDLYVMQDGTHATYAEVTLDHWGLLRNKNGVAVCMDADGDPQMVGSDAVRNMNVMEAERAKKAAAEAAVMRDVNDGKRPSDEARSAAGLPPLPAKTPAQPSAAVLAKSIVVAPPPHDPSHDEAERAKKAAVDKKREVKAAEEGAKGYETR